MENNPEKKKLKWRLNLFDIIFISCAVIVAVVILIYSSRSAGKAGIVSPGTVETVLYTVELQGMVNEAAALIKPGDSLVDKVEQRAIGTVVSVDLRPAQISQKDMVSGDRIISEVPLRTDAVIVISAQATTTDTQISVNGYNIRVGLVVSINGPLYNGGGFIIDIDRGDEA